LGASGYGGTQNYQSGS